MSGAAQGNVNTTKANVSDVHDPSKPLNTAGNKPPAAQLEEDDEFEDFPVEGMTTIKDTLSATMSGAHRVLRAFVWRLRQCICFIRDANLGGQAFMKRRCANNYLRLAQGRGAWNRRQWSGNDTSLGGKLGR